MLNETNSELEERSDKAAVEEMAIRSEVQLPAPIYHEQQEIEAKEWNKHYYGY